MSCLALRRRGKVNQDAKDAGMLKPGRKGGGPAYYRPRICMKVVADMSGNSTESQGGREVQPRPLLLRSGLTDESKKDRDKEDTGKKFSREVTK